MKNWFFGSTRALHLQFFRYLFVGGSAAVVDLLLYAVLTEYAAVHYLLAAFIAYVCGFAWNYVISILWIFESRHARAKEVTMVFLISMGGLLLTELLLYVGVDHLGIQHIVAKIIVLWIVLVWNFGMRKWVVFR